MEEAYSGQVLAVVPPMELEEGDTVTISEAEAVVGLEDWSTETT